MKIICAEKPSVGKTIAQVVGATNKEEGYMEGNGYIVTWCLGHLVTMSYPEAYNPALKKWSLDPLPFLPDEYKYEVIDDTGAKKQYEIIKKIFSDFLVPGSELINAGDSGREGEAIQRLVYNQIGVKSGVIMKRLWIDSQTEDEINRGLREAKDASHYDNLAEAAYTRAIEDYAIGINLSRALSCKFGHEFNQTINSDKYIPIAVGRVMTCVLGMVVDREREIKNFKPSDYYKIDGNHQTSNESFVSHWKLSKESTLYSDADLYNEQGFAKKEKAEEILEKLKQSPTVNVKSLTSKTEKQNAPVLFNLAELQAECSKRYKISPEETLAIAQKLYEGKMTTYPRTDARVLSIPIAKEIERNIKGVGDHNPSLKKYSEDILQRESYKGISGIKRYCDDSKITDHYAIIPTGEGDPSSLSGLDKSVYELICRRFLAIFMPPAEYEKNEAVLVHETGEIFTSSEKILLKPGFKALYDSEESKDKEKEVKTSVLKTLKQGEDIPADFTLITSTTQPPKRYTSGSMILAMENAGKLIEDEELREQIKGCGIGTSATRAETISKLIRNNYISLNKKTQIITPTGTGEAIYEIVKINIPSLLSPEMTANWEKGLAKIEKGEITKADYLQLFEKFIRKSVEDIKSKTAEGAKPFKPEVVGPCPLCGLNVRTTVKGGLLCTGYVKDDENSCHFSIPGAPLGKKLTKEQVMTLFNGGETELIEGFKSKKGNVFSAYLFMENGKMSFRLPDFNDLPGLGECPVCKSKVMMGKYGAYCTNKCGMQLGRARGKLLTESQVKTLLEGKSITLRGLKKKNGEGKYDIILKPTGTEPFSYTNKEGKEVSGMQFAFETSFPKSKKKG